MNPTNPYDTIQQLRQRVAELEEMYELSADVASTTLARNAELTAERDKATQYWQVAEGRCDALMRDKNYLLLNAEVAMNCIRDMGPSKPAVKAYSILQEAIASVKEKQNAAD